MATTNYLLNKPTVGASEDTWGGDLNDNFDTLDSLLGGDTGINGINLVTFKVDGVSVTATAAELNILDGLTATTTELNYVGGVTSGIQSQLNGKVDDSQVLTDVPANAVFTDTIYTKPASEPISYISGLQTALNNLQDEIDAIETGGGSYVSTTDADFVKLTQVTATSTELNYVDGVTSSIQNQLNLIRSRLDVLEGGSQ